MSIAATETPVQVFKIGPESVPAGRNVGRVVYSDTLTVLAHVWDKGGETALHSHHSSDASWVVLDGEATFYGENNELLGKLRHADGIFIPHNIKYWFESTADEPLVMVRAASKPAGVGDDRVYVASEK